jgi:hypothetical protein
MPRSVDKYGLHSTSLSSPKPNRHMSESYTLATATMTETTLLFYLAVAGRVAAGATFA